MCVKYYPRMKSNLFWTFNVHFKHNIYFKVGYECIQIIILSIERIFVDQKLMYANFSSINCAKKINTPVCIDYNG